MTMASLITLDHSHLLTSTMGTRNGQMTCEPLHRIDVSRIRIDSDFRPHDGFLQMAKPYIAAFHAGSKTVDGHIESDQLIYWYRLAWSHTQSQLFRWQAQWLRYHGGRCFRRCSPDICRNRHRKFWRQWSSDIQCSGRR